MNSSVPPPLPSFGSLLDPFSLGFFVNLKGPVGLADLERSASLDFVVSFEELVGFGLDDFESRSSFGFLVNLEGPVGFADFGLRSSLGFFVCFEEPVGFGFADFESRSSFGFLVNFEGPVGLSFVDLTPEGYFVIAT